MYTNHLAHRRFPEGVTVIMIKFTIPSYCWFYKHPGCSNLPQLCIHYFV